MQTYDTSAVAKIESERKQKSKSLKSEGENQ